MTSANRNSDGERTRQLQEILRLSTAEYDCARDLFHAYIQAGKTIFDQPFGAVVSEDGEAIAGDPSFEGTLRTAFQAPDGQVQYLMFGNRPPGPEDATSDAGVLAWMAKAIAYGLRHTAAENERLRGAAELMPQAWQDPLTGLPNRSRLENWISGAAERADRSGKRVGVLFIDLDRIKQVNDTLGHSTGDRVLVETASRIRRALGQDHWVSRVGADEFAVVAPELSGAEEAIAVGHRLLESLRIPYAMSGYEFVVTASIGVSLYPDHGRDPETLLQAADAAMYTAKRHGRNDCRIFTSEFALQAIGRFELEAQLRSALENGELQLLYQPIVLLDGTLESVEVLLTWDSPRFGRVSAARFVPIAEEAGMIVTIGSWVLRQACEQCAKWLRCDDGPQKVAVNVSSLQFARTDFLQTVTDALGDSGLPPGRLEFEITESAIMRNIAESRRCFEALRQLGVGLSIDDFGTGYSSLSYLRDLPVDTLKIDRSFLSEGGQKGPALVQAIVLMAHNLGLAVTAEGVETETQLELLRAVGCDRAQGHLFGEAVPADKLKKNYGRAVKE